jgi:adiponectin receptor
MPGLHPYTTAPHWTRHNAYLRTGYRGVGNWMHSLRSVLQWHNETCNIWTHLLAAIGFVVTWGVTRLVVTPRVLPFWPLDVFFVSAVFCFSASTVYHCFNCVSPRTCSRLLCLDYCGIGCMIAGTCFAEIFILYFCRPVLRTLFACTAWGGPLWAIWILSSASLDESHKKVTLAWVGCATVAMAPIVVSGPGWFMAGLLAYGIGVGFFLCRVPERFFPERWDYGCHSHVCMHLGVIIGAMCHTVTLFESFHARNAHACA